VRLRTGFERLLEWIVIVLMSSLAVLVAVAVVYRKAGASLVWYDEIASVLLAWITFYGAALAALRGAHIGVSALVDAMPPKMRMAATLFAEACVVGFFCLLAWVGVSVLEVLATDNLVSLPAISVVYTQSVIPIGSVLFVIAELLRLPEVLRAAAPRAGVNP
jgi:TRAP-type C4-dicarboxylate transport system permease small subunit